MKLDVGCGPVRMEGYVPIDRSLGHDVRSIPVLPESCDEIRASHVLEHIPHGETLSCLKHWVDLLRPGGVLKISVPDFDWIVKRYCSDDSQALPLEAYLMGGQIDIDDHHAAIFNVGKLTNLMEMAGLESIGPWVGTVDTSTHPCSLNLCGKKSVVEPRVAEQRRDVVFAMTLPRLGFTENSTNLLLAMSQLGFSAVRSGGAFWEAGMTRAFDSALAVPGVKWIVAVDYDTVFSPQDLLTMLEQADRLNLDALAPLQVGRERETVLLTVNDKEGNPAGRVLAPEPTDEVFEVSTMHFGLTLIRADKLRALPYPWFIGHTAPNNTWGEGRTDADIHFWRHWIANGNKAHTTWRVRVGHLQLVVSWPDRSLRTRHQYLTNWTTGGKPHYAQ